MVALESSKLFRRLPAAELEKLRRVARELSFAAGQPIFTEGDPGDGIYIVKRGQVRISVRVGAEERQISQLAPGEIFGEMAVVDNQPRSASARAEGETAVYFIPREPLLELVRQSPELALLLMQEISGRLREFNRQYLREVLQVERMALVGRFASSIVHDLKNPLAIINLGADMACAEHASADRRRTARQRIAKQVERIMHLVNDILEFTRGAPAEVVLVATDYAAFVQSVIDELQPEAALKSVILELENPPPALKVPLHPRRLNRVFYNLITNAVDMMPNGGKIKLSFTTTDTEIITEVKDTGPGIAPEIADRLFDTFVTFGKQRGTGLGLSITRRIVEEHGGRISARNLPEGGAAFTFTLPRERPRKS